MVLVSSSRNPKLFECTKESIAKAVITASEMGLDCSGSLGSGYLVPYFNGKIGAYEAQFIPGYRGLIDLARRSGHVKSIEAHVVYKDDSLDIEFGLEPKLSHKPNPMVEPQDKNIVGAYMVAQLIDDAKHVEYMTRAEIDKIRNRSKASNSGPWVTDYAEMCRKTVVRRGAKYLPLSPELERLIEYDNTVNGIDLGVQASATPAEPAKPRTEALKDKLKGQVNQETGEVTDAIEMASDEQISKLAQLCIDIDLDETGFYGVLGDEYGVNATKDLTAEQANALIERFSKSLEAQHENATAQR